MYKNPRFAVGFTDIDGVEEENRRFIESWIIAFSLVGRRDNVRSNKRRLFYCRQLTHAEWEEKKVASNRDMVKKVFLDRFSLQKVNIA